MPRPRSPFVVSTESVRRLVLGTIAAMALAGTARAQDRLIDFGEPILVFGNGGHHAPVRDLIFTSDQNRLLSAGHDKVVRVWDVTADPPRLEWTIRPALWRGRTGRIQAMALSPPVGDGPQVLAVAGHGIDGQRGAIGLYRFPGAPDRRTGDVLGTLAFNDNPPVPGHRGVVNDLAFSPSGNLLASASLDGTVRLWDYRGMRQLAELKHPRLASGPAHGFTALAFTPNGERLITGTTDGRIYVWSIQTAALDPNEAALHAAPFLEDRVNAVACSPDGRWVAVGWENGRVIRFDSDGRRFVGNPSLLRKPDGKPVEALAATPDGRLLVSKFARPYVATERPVLHCNVELLTMPDGTVARALRSAASNPPNPVPGLVGALAASPGGRFLAFSGGDDQAIEIHRLDDPNLPQLARIGGLGESVWQVGFSNQPPRAPEDVVVAFSHQPSEAGAAASFTGFALADRAPRLAFPRDQVHPPQATFEAWSVRPVSAYQLQVLQNNQVAFNVDLSPVRDGRWWAWTFIPPSPDHARATLAVAAREGVAIYRLDTRARTRFLDGHSSDVLALAPSPDGRWLATGSADQTVRLWALAGCDVVAPLGATFERRAEDRAVVVKSVAPRSFADISGYRVGDVVAQAAVDGVVLDVGDELLGRLTSLGPNTTVELRVNRPPAAGAAPAQGARPLVDLFTSLRERPVLSLFVNPVTEWVAWMPRGYYDTSVVGDSDFLGWHRNRSSAPQPVGPDFFRQPAPSDYLPLVKFEDPLRQRRGVAGNRIDILLATADENRALNGEPAEAAPEPVRVFPPRIVPRAAAGGPALRDGPQPLAVGQPLPDRITADPGPLAIDWLVQPETLAAGVASFELRLNGEVLPTPANLPAADPATGAVLIPTRIPLEPGLYRLTARARNTQGRDRDQGLTVEVAGPPTPPPRDPQLTVVVLAPSYGGRFPDVDGSAQDAKDLPTFLSRYLVAPDGLAFEVPPPNPGLVGAAATTGKVLDVLPAAGKGGAPQRGDAVVVLVEAHTLRQKQGVQLVLADSQGLPPEPAVPSDEISRRLGELARQGCRVVVILDTIHPPLPGHAGKWDADVMDWVRELYLNYGVITAVASKWKPSDLHRLSGHRVLVQSILTADQARPRGRIDRQPVITLGDFRAQVIDSARRLTNGAQQDADVLIPQGLELGSGLLAPRPRPR